MLKPLSPSPKVDFLSLNTNIFKLNDTSKYPPPSKNREYFEDLQIYTRKSHIFQSLIFPTYLPQYYRRKKIENFWGYYSVNLVQKNTNKVVDIIRQNRVLTFLADLWLRNFFSTGSFCTSV